MKALKYILALFVASVVVSCYEDEGNYIYNEDIHDISVKLKGSYGLRKTKGLIQYSITPEVETVDGDKSYLEYLWLLRNNKNGVEDTVGLAEQVDLEFDSDASDFSSTYDLVLYVTDTKTGGVTMAPTKIEFAMPYSYAWLLLHETDDHAELGTVEYIASDMVVVPNVYTQEQGQSMTGKPVNLSVVKKDIQSYNWFGSTTPAQVYVTTTNPAESGWYEQREQFSLMGTWDELIWPTLAEEFDPQNMQTTGDNQGLMMVCNGKLFRSCPTSPIIFKGTPDVTFEGDYYITKSVGGSNCSLAYDELGHRFVYVKSASWYGYPSGESKGATLYPIRDVADNAANPNQLPAGEKIIKLINGYWYDRVTTIAVFHRYSAYAYSLDEGGKSHVYVFRYRGLSSSDTTPMPYRFTFNTPAGVNENTPMTSSWEYNNILFYAVGNEIYKLDFSTGQTTLIYSHPDASAEFVDLKMGVEGYVAVAGFGDYSLYGHPYSRCLGAALNTQSGEGELVVLQLNSVGKVDEDHKFPSVQVHKGFGKIKEIEFF